MKNYIHIAFLSIIVLSFTQCADVDSAMLFGGPDEGYLFNNDLLPDEYQVDENLVEIFTLISSGEGVDDAEIAAVYVGDKNDIANDTVILYCHGNAPSMDIFWPVAAQLANIQGKHHYGVMMYDYRGFGRSKGTSTGLESMEADLSACMTWLKEQGLTDDRLVLFGNSLGTIPAGHWVAEEQILNTDKLILEVPQSSANAIGQDATGLSIPASFLTDFTFDIPESVANYSGDLLWMHGTEDRTAPINNARQIYQAHNGNYKDSVVIENAPHGLREYMGAKEWGKAIGDFLLQ